LVFYSNIILGSKLRFSEFFRAFEPFLVASKKIIWDEKTMTDPFNEITERKSEKSL